MGTRERLLEAGIRLLSERGYAHMTTRQIVAAADAHVPAVNYFFGSKEKLLREAIVHALRRWSQAIMAAADDAAPMDPRERLKRGFQRFFVTLETDRPYAVAALEAFAQAERDDELRDQLAATYQEFREIVARDIEPDTGDVDGAVQSELLHVSSTLLALFDGFAIQWLLDPSATPDAEQILASLAAIGSALAAPADSTVFDVPTDVDFATVPQDG